VTGSGLQIWEVASDGSDDKLPTATFKYALVPNNTAHSSAVNVLRFSPSGTLVSDFLFSPLEPILHTEIYKVSSSFIAYVTD
jgi:hypothetical protein